MKSKEQLIKLELLKTTGYNNYNGWNNRTDFGYHSYNLNNIDITGQRNPAERINIFEKHISFENKNVIDFGCNVGAMLHHLSGKIKFGVGLDYDVKSVTAGNNISKILNVDQKIKIYHHDFDLNSYEQLDNMLGNCDIALLLSLGSWVKSWRKLYQLAINKSHTIIFETNNPTEGIPQLNFFETNNKNIVQISKKSLDDTTGNLQRQVYLIT